MDRPDVETGGIHAPAVLRVAAVILVALALVVFACRGLLAIWHIPADTSPSGSGRFPSDAPRLQSAPQDERAAYFAEKEKLLHDYAWVDRRAGTVRIPIEAAMAMMVERQKGRRP
ncbi:MAG TPA: hypothetical protein VFF03_18040 [Rhodocyclaceae bacterium]|nr:hypothetical protein [Rhodocyclaceae bacterium]